MIPSFPKPKYKFLTRLLLRLRSADIWNNLKTKSLKKKKWRELLYIPRIRKKSKSITRYIDKALPTFPQYRRYHYQKQLLLRQRIKLVLGGMQSYRLKAISVSIKKKSELAFISKIEQKVPMFLYRYKLVYTYKEAKIHFNKKRIFVNDSAKNENIGKGDILHFSPLYTKFLKNRFFFRFSSMKKTYRVKKKYMPRLKKKYSKIKNFKRKKNYYLKKITYLKPGEEEDKKKDKRLYRKVSYRINLDNINVELDIASFRFFFINDIIYHRNHPFLLIHSRIFRWYSRF